MFQFGCNSFRCDFRKIVSFQELTKIVNFYKIVRILDYKEVCSNFFPYFMKIFHGLNVIEMHDI